MKKIFVGMLDEGWEWLMLDTVVSWAWKGPFLLFWLPPVSVCANRHKYRQMWLQTAPALEGQGLKGVCAGRCMCFMGVESLSVMIIARGRIELHALLVEKRRKVREKRL